MSDLLERLETVHSMVPSHEDLFREAAREIESLQREKEERVKAHNEIFDALQKSEMDNEFLRGQLSDWEMTPRGAQEIIQRQADRISELEAAAITPEMRERIKQIVGYLDRSGNLLSLATVGTADLLRDLLGEQG